MSQHPRRIGKWGALLAFALAAGACGGAGATRAQTTAAALHPPAPTATTYVVPTVTTNPVALPEVTTTIASPPATAAPTPTTATPVGPAPTTPRAPAPTAAVTQPSPTTAVTAPQTTPSPPALAARRQPTAGEVSQVIATVHGLLPIYTLTPAQIATVGNLVCTAFDQGQSFSQVKAGFLQMVGAAAYSSLVPAAVPDTSVRTLVPMYCPGYGPKLV